MISVRHGYVVGVLKDAGIAPSNSTKGLTTFPFTGHELDPDVAHVRRYISSLAIPYTASQCLMRSLHKYSEGNVQLSMPLLIVGADQTIDVTVVERLKMALKNWIRARRRQ